MKIINPRILALTALTATTLYTSAAIAEDVILNVTADVQNAITIVETTPMNFGTFVAINDAADTASATITTAGVLSVAAPGDAVLSSTGGTPTAGVVTVTAADGASVNMSIAVPSAVANGGDAMTLDNLTILIPGAGSSTAIIGGGAAIPFVADGTAQAVTFGGRLTLPASATQFADGAYAGTIVVTAAY